MTRTGSLDAERSGAVDCGCAVAPPSCPATTIYDTPKPRDLPKRAQAASVSPPATQNQSASLHGGAWLACADERGSPPLPLWNGSPAQVFLNGLDRKQHTRTAMRPLEPVPAIRRIETDRADLCALDVVGHLTSADLENAFGLLEAAYVGHPA